MRMRAYPFYADQYHNRRWAPNVVHGLGALGALNPGSKLRVGFAFQWSDTLGYDPIASGYETNLASEIQANLVNYLNDGVTFRDVTARVDHVPDYAYDGYVIIEATTAGWTIPDANVFGDMAAYILSQYLPILTVTKRDAVQIDYSAPAPPTPAPTPTPTTPPATTPPPQPSQCNLNQQGLAKWIACQFGLKDSKGDYAAGTGAMIGLGGAALLLVLLMKKK